MLTQYGNGDWSLNVGIHTTQENTRGVGSHTNKTLLSTHTTYYPLVILIQCVW